MWSCGRETQPGWPLQGHVLHTFCTCVSPTLAWLVHFLGPQGASPLLCRASPERKRKCGLVVPADHTDTLTTSSVGSWDSTGHNACSRKIGMLVACREQLSTAFPRTILGKFWALVHSPYKAEKYRPSIVEPAEINAAPYPIRSFPLLWEETSISESQPGYGGFGL
jgi:hypothetical protein